MFIQENRTKLKLKAGQPAYGVLSTSDDPQLAELFGLAGFDYYMLDAEHGLMDSVQVVNVIRACAIISAFLGSSFPPFSVAPISKIKSFSVP